MKVVTATKSNNTLTVFVNDNGVVKPIPATSEHPKWAELVKAWTEQNHELMLELLSMKRIVEKFSSGDLVVSDTGVFYREVPLVGIDVDRLMAFMRQGEPYQPIANYMVRKLKNPSKRAITEMYSFLEHKNMPLTPNGTILAYKGVQQDFFSVSSGKEILISGRRNEAGQIFNGVGEVVEMNRSDVDDDFRRGCSGGLHAGSLGYAKDWARQHGGIIILIEIDPSDVVSVPEECNCSKLRCCKYRVIGTYDGPLPDTYTADYSQTSDTILDEKTCDNCGLSAEDCECDQEEETCDDCGCEVDYCECDDEKEECGCCNASCEKCYPDTDSESPEEGRLRRNEAWLYEQAKKEDKSVPTAGDMSPMDPSIQPMQGPVTQAVPMTVTLPIEKETVNDQSNLTELSEEAKFRQKIVAMLGDQTMFDPANITDDKTLNDLGFDSLDGIEFIMALEEEFKPLTITDDEAESFGLGGGVGELIARLWKALHPPPAATEKTTLNPPTSTTYQEGYQLGLRNGINRRKRLYYQEDEAANEFERGYCDGYRAGRKDYKH